MCFHTTIQLWNHKLITFLAISISVGVGVFLCRVERPSILGRVERPSILGRVERPSLIGSSWNHLARTLVNTWNTVALSSYLTHLSLSVRIVSFYVQMGTVDTFSL